MLVKCPCAKVLPVQLAATGLCSTAHENPNDCAITVHKTDLKRADPSRQAVRYLPRHRGNTVRAKLLLPLTVSLVVQCSWAGTFFRAGAWQVEYHPGTQYIGCSATTSAPSGPTLSLSIGPRAVHEADGARVLFRHALTAAYRAHPAATPAGFRFDSANGTRTVEHKAPLTREALVAARDLVHTLVQQRAVSIVPKQQVASHYVRAGRFHPGAAGRVSMRARQRRRDCGH
jgi:hypothetical protein